MSDVLAFGKSCCCCILMSLISPAMTTTVNIYSPTSQQDNSLCLMAVCYSCHQTQTFGHRMFSFCSAKTIEISLLPYPPLNPLNMHLQHFCSMSITPNNNPLMPVYLLTLSFPFFRLSSSPTTRLIHETLSPYCLLPDSSLRLLVWLSLLICMLFILPTFVCLCLVYLKI